VSDTAEPIILSFPRGGYALPAMRVVAGWVASRNHLALDQLDDTTLAIETLVAGEPIEGCPVSLSVHVVGGCLHLLLGGLQNRDLQANLESDKTFEPSARWPIDVRLFLGALVDEYKVVECGAGVFSVQMRKRIK
jgi:hypothetical protein